jgi:hypothetical protein
MAILICFSHLSSCRTSSFARGNSIACLKSSSIALHYAVACFGCFSSKHSGVQAKARLVAVFRKTEKGCFVIGDRTDGIVVGKH